jgi:hypothetical protein
MPSAVNLRPHKPTGPRRTSAQARQRGRPSRLCPRIGPREGRRADARATAEGLDQLICKTNRRHQELRFVSGCSIRVASGQFEIPPVRVNSRRTVDVAASTSNEPATRRLGWSGPYGEEFAPDKSASAIKGRADHAWRDRHPAKECVGSNRNEKNDRNFPLQRQSRRIPLRTKTLTHYQFHEKGETRTALPMRNSLDRNHSHLTNSFRNGPPDRRCFATRSIKPTLVGGPRADTCTSQCFHARRGTHLQNSFG